MITHIKTFDFLSIGVLYPVVKFLAKIIIQGVSIYLENAKKTMISCTYKIPNIYFKIILEKIVFNVSSIEIELSIFIRSIFFKRLSIL